MDLSSTVSSFTHFPKLPVEIRLNIWEYASLLPRNLDIWNVAHGITYLDGSSQDGVVSSRYTTSSPPPAILHVCRESRTTGLKHYKLAFGQTRSIGKGVTISAPPRIYVNFENDTICPIAVWEDDKKEWALTILENNPDIKTVAINTIHWHDFYGRFPFHLRPFRGRDLILYYWDPLFREDVQPGAQRFILEFEDLKPIEELEWTTEDGTDITDAYVTSELERQCIYDATSKLLYYFPTLEALELSPDLRDAKEVMNPGGKTVVLEDVLSNKIAALRKMRPIIYQKHAKFNGRPLLKKLVSFGARPS